MITAVKPALENEAVSNEQIAKLTGIAKSMLKNIERCNLNNIHDQLGKLNESELKVIVTLRVSVKGQNILVFANNKYNQLLTLNLTTSQKKSRNFMRDHHSKKDKLSIIVELLVAAGSGKLMGLPITG